MTEDILNKRTWSDSQLLAAVTVSSSWRGVMRELGLCVTSAGSIQAVKRHVTRLDLDTSHFRGQRRWSDAQLKQAVASAQSWHEVLSQLGRVSYNKDDRTRIKAHAIRLGLDLSRLDAPRAVAAAQPEFQPDIKPWEAPHFSWAAQRLPPEQGRNALLTASGGGCEGRVAS